LRQICRKGREAGVAIGMFTGNPGELPKWQEMGASLFLLGSDHGFMLNGADALIASLR